MNTKKRVILMSAELSTLTSFENADRTESLRMLLTNKGYNITSVLGSYKGKLERSFLIDASEDIVKPLQGVAGYFGQESILVVNEDQKANLIYSNGKTEQIGTMSQVNFIGDKDSWTLVNGLFYSVV